MPGLPRPPGRCLGREAPQEPAIRLPATPRSLGSGCQLLVSSHLPGDRAGTPLYKVLVSKPLWWGRGCDPLPSMGVSPRTQPHTASLGGDNAPRHPGTLKLSHPRDMMPHSPVPEMWKGLLCNRQGEIVCIPPQNPVAAVLLVLTPPLPCP